MGPSAGVGGCGKSHPHTVIMYDTEKTKQKIYEVTHMLKGRATVAAQRQVPYR